MMRRNVLIFVLMSFGAFGCAPQRTAPTRRDFAATHDFPYQAAKERSERIRREISSMSQRMPQSLISEKLGPPDYQTEFQDTADFLRKLFEKPKHSWVYAIRANYPNSIHDDDVYWEIYFDSQGMVEDVRYRPSR
jgi:hypothetical protein